MYVSGLAPFLEGYNPAWAQRFDQLYGYNPTRAKELLKEAGYPPGTLPVKSGRLPNSPSRRSPSSPRWWRCIFKP